MKFSDNPTTAFIESNKIEDIFDKTAPLEDMALAWEFLKDQDTLTLDNIAFTHWIVTHRQLPPNERGKYRYHNRTNVQVGGRVAPHWSHVKHLLENWLLDARSGDAIATHIAFEHIHPFVDGNGRTGRLIYYWQNPDAEILTYKDRLSYYKWF